MATGKELQDQGVKLFQDRDYEAAQGIFKQATDAFNAEGASDMAAEMQVNAALVDRTLGNYEASATAMIAARQVFAGMGDKLREAQVIGNLGGVYLAQGNNEQASTLYREAADLFKEVGDEEKYGQTLLAMAEIQMKDRKFLDALVTYEVALDSIQDLNIRQRMMKGLIGLKNRVMGGGVPASETVADVVPDATAARLSSTDEPGDTPPKL